MAWLDDRIWAHPKFQRVEPAARWIAVSAICYSHGFGLAGRLDPGQQRVIGSTARIRRQLVAAELWEEDGGDIIIHDWKEHNGKRDEKKQAERDAARERKRKQRARERGEDPQVTAPVTPDVTPDVTRDIPVTSLARASAGARLMTNDGMTEPKAVTSTEDPAREPNEANGLGPHDQEDPNAAAEAWALVERTATNLRSP